MQSVGAYPRSREVDVQDSGTQPVDVKVRKPSEEVRTHATANERTPESVDGIVAPGFEEVRAEFVRNFVERG